jgi:long-subunit fatty acid transport protein
MLKRGKQSKDADNLSAGFIRRLCFAAVCILLYAADAAFAGGPVHGAKAAGMGTAFVAVADDPSAILHNPAGLIKLKTQIFMGAALLLSLRPSLTAFPGPVRRQNSSFIPLPICLFRQP